MVLMVKKGKPHYKRKSGNPAKDISDADRVMKVTREGLALVKDLEGRVSEETHTYLRAAVLALIWTHDELKSLPTPDTRIK